MDSVMEVSMRGLVILGAVLVVLGAGCSEDPRRTGDGSTGDTGSARDNGAADARSSQENPPTPDAAFDAGSGGDGPPADGPSADTGPAADGPVADGPVADGPVADGPVADSPAPDQSKSDAAAGTMKSSVSQYGITWTFDKPYPCGQFVTGDWWVVGPAVVASVQPAPTATRNGSMLDPVGKQAYDSRAGEYDGAKGVKLPLTLTPTHSLVSSISHPEASACTQGGAPGWFTYNNVCQRGPIKTQAVLTAVAAPQPADTFRPPYAGSSYKPLRRVSEVCWKLLPKLPAPSSAPQATSVLRHLERPWIDHLNSWTMQHGCATLNMFCYGREIGDIVSIVSAYALLDTPSQQQVATRLIQLGLDNYGVIKAGGGWGVDGGHFNGRKWPIVLAGALLGDAAMRSPGAAIGNEDQQTYYGTNGKALFGKPCSNACYFTSGCTYAGSCQAGSKDCRDPAGLVDGCADYRNCCTSYTWVGEGLAALVLGLKADWGHDAFFDYVDRWMTGDVAGGGGTSSQLVTDLWKTYRNNLPTPGSCP